MKLTNENANDFIRKIEKFFDSMNISRKDRIKLCLMLEESLIRFQEKFGENHDFKFVTRKWFGTPKVIIRVKGTPYNPIEDNDDENIFPEIMMQNILNYDSSGVTYSYRNGFNEITVSPKKEKQPVKIPGGSITIAILLAILFGVIGNILPKDMQIIIAEDVITPILDTLLGAVIAVNIPMIFVSVVAGICAFEDVTMLNEVGTKVLKRFFAIMFFIAALSIAVCAVIFPVVNFEFSEDVSLLESLDIQKLFALILAIVPKNAFAPFVEGNILQIIVIAIITGICITVLGKRVGEFKILIINVKQIIFKAMDIVFKVIPAIVFLCILKTILADSLEEILSVWRIIAAEYVLFLAVVLIMLLRNSIKYGIGVTEFIKKISPAFSISFTTSGGSASVPVNIKVCKENLKIDENLCDFYVPLSYALCSTTLIIGIVTCVFFAAYFSNLEISVGQLLIIAFLSVQFSVCGVEGNGGMIAIMSLLLTQLGFSLDAIGPITVTDIFVVNISGVVSWIITNCDLFDFSHQINFTADKH